jgi:hypothetical protein
MESKTESTIESKLTFKIFAGFLINGEIKMHLQDSILWKQALVDRSTHSKELIEIYFDEKEFIGQYMEKNEFILEELYKMHEQLKKSLQRYCPDCNIETLKFSIFAQVFIA